MTRFVYVLPAGRFRWEVRSMATTAKGARLHYRLKRDALIAARAIAILIGGEVQPRNRWGRIQNPSSFGNDPPERKG